MGLNKKDRRISIWIGIIIGVTLSSMLFRYAIKDKNERSLLRPGSYESNITAVEGLPFLQFLIESEKPYRAACALS